MKPNRMTKHIIAALAPAMLLLGSTQAQTVYDPATQFSAASNPSALWSYGYSLTSGSPLIPFEERLNQSGVDIWRHNISFGAPGVSHNPTASAISFGPVVVDAGGLVFHPGPNDEFTILRFIAPSAGDYHVAGSFYGADMNGTTTDVHILANGLSAFDGAVAGFGAGSGPSFDKIVTLSRGGFLDFAVGFGSNGSFFSDSTGLSAQISVVSETSATASDFNADGKPDYLLFNPGTQQTSIWTLNGSAFVSSASGPTVAAGYQLVAVADFNGNGKPDYVLFNPSTRQSAVWYLNGTTYAGGGYGPTLPAGWSLVAIGDFNGDGKSDYVLFNASTRQSAIWYLNGVTYTGGAFGPTAPSGWALQGAADFNANGKPDFVLFEASTRKTAIWYLNGVSYAGGVFGPTLASGFDLVAP